ncbi:MAG TPA: hypothetical protein VFW34_06800 [Candidatus Rubrimentiphilum sp.]|nr:hypothetical protein [Candidatus Rubrimentiphilum sp.]
MSTLLAGLVSSRGAQVRAAILVPTIVSHAQVRTIAGDGLAGYRDGQANQASFLYPIAVAYDKNSGAIVVADAEAQRIRRISPAGDVTTLAGSGNLLPSGLRVQGGYRDGLPSQAQFNHPSGVAVGAGNVVYVSDSFNHCIRVIRDGRVSTYAGDPNAAGAKDGAAANATFTEPRGLALGTDGTLYVADYGVGIREIDPKGIVATLPVDARLSKSVSSVALLEGQSPGLFFASRSGTAFFEFGSRKTRLDRERPALIPYGLIAISGGQYVASTMRGNRVYYSDFLGGWLRLIAGNSERDESNSGGFADGPPDVARFQAPAGLTLDGQHNIVVADAGNRRIRLIPAIDSHLPLAANVSADPETYQVAFVSNSAAFYDALGPDSIEGTIERHLNALRHQNALTKPVRVYAIPVSSSNLASAAQYIEDVLGQGQFSLIIWSLNSHMFLNDFTGWQARLPQMTPSKEALWRRTIIGVSDHLKRMGTKLLVTDQPLGGQVGFAENAVGRDNATLDLDEPFRDALQRVDYAYAVNKEIERFLASLGLRYLPTYEKFLAVERRAHRPLYPADDFHFSVAGNEFFGTLLANYLSEWRPWRAQ